MNIEHRTAKAIVGLLLGMAIMALLLWTMMVSEAQVTTGPNRGSSSAGTNNQTWTGQNVITTNLLIDARTSPGTISPTNSLEAIGTNGLKLFNIGRNTGYSYFGTNVVIKSSILNSAGVAVIQPNSTFIRDASAVPAIDWGARILYDSAGASSFAWATRSLNDSASTASLNWEDRRLSDSNGIVSINWKLGNLNDPATENTTVDWINGVLATSAGATALDWKNRTTTGAWAFTGASGAFTNSIATYSTTSTNSIAATGITNTSAFNRHAMLTVTASAFAIKNYEGTIIYNSAAALTAVLHIPLQPGAAITGASGLSGTLLPY